MTGGAATALCSAVRRRPAAVASQPSAAIWERAGACSGGELVASPPSRGRFAQSSSSCCRHSLSRCSRSRSASRTSGWRETSSTVPPTSRRSAWWAMRWGFSPGSLPFRPWRPRPWWLGVSAGAISSVPVGPPVRRSSSAPCWSGSWGWRPPWGEGGWWHSSDYLPRAPPWRWSTSRSSFRPSPR